MREEYKAIVDAGFLVQIDDPRLVTYYIIHPEASIADCRKWAEVRVEALNHALRDIPPEKIRFHTCYGINMGPRIHDMELKDIVDIILKINARRLFVRGRQSAPRARMEGVEGRQAAGRQDADPGVISHSTILVEHPELVAERIVRYATWSAARTSSPAPTAASPPSPARRKCIPIVWAKFKALSDGARIASKELWG